MKKVDLVLFIGQSNMAGRGEATTKLELNAGLEYRAISSPNKLYPIEEPFGVNENNPDGIYDVFDNTKKAKTGSLVTSFCNAYYAITHTTIVGVSASKGGSPISEWQIDSSQGYLKDAIERLTAAKVFLQDNGYDIQHTFALWCQGESDGDLGTTKEEYVKMFGKVWSELHKVIPNMFIIKIGECNIEGSYRRYDEIRTAQDIIINTYENIYLASDSFFGLREKDLMKDAFHYKQVGYDLCGADAGTRVGLIIQDKKHIVITGSIGSGKSTLLNQLTSRLGVKEVIPGVVTWNVPGKAVYMRKVGSEESEMIGECNPNSLSKTNRMQPVLDGFNIYGISLLEKLINDDSEWITIDEIGYLESASLPYLEKLSELFEQKRVMAVVRKQDIKHINDIIQRKDSLVIDLDD